jgi:hypothetical protein
MSVANVAAVEAAILTVLSADAALTALLPHGVWLDIGKKGSTRFAVVQHQTHVDEEGFRAPLYEEFRYRITARVLDLATTAADAAAYRIHELLEDQVLTITGYTHMSTLRVERIKTTEVDAIDNDIRWQIAGGDYEIHVSPD